MERQAYLRHIENEKDHWWFCSRRKIIDHLIKLHFTKKEKNIEILDFGAGSGTNINMLNKYGNVDVYEQDILSLTHLKNKFQDRPKIKIIEKLEKVNFYDLIIAADVIEHIKDDKLTIDQLLSSLKKEGKILVTVPAYQFLFSNKDVSLHHFRRYTKSSLNKLFENNCKIIKSSYFNFFLFLPLSISILIMKFLNIKFIDKVEKKPNFFINKFLYFIFSSESTFLKFIDFPFGISIFTFCKKKN